MLKEKMKDSKQEMASHPFLIGIRSRLSDLGGVHGDVIIEVASAGISLNHRTLTFPLRHRLSRS